MYQLQILLELEEGHPHWFDVTKIDYVEETVSFIDSAWEEIDVDYGSEPLRIKEEVSDDSDKLLVSNNRDVSSCD